MALIDRYNCAQDVNFRQRVQTAMCAAAINIQAEATATANHSNRANYAKLVLNSPDQYAPLFAQAICANDATLTIQSLQAATVTDTIISNDVSAVWNALAGTV